ncbi:IclR family transcriptional regulator [Rhodococcus spongiicola]|uniref:IclR family transcriptional regulator n=1 Tax=Rhodococcus spongiicola TaxID=2487352 RepID=A0A438B1H4_9NOCA|nr:IclR family transcriptional regulator [Rhodococcus spongiicola]RVW04813.1 IclR family transcriptional regulator [Rhodococcus spongiicola]
MDSPNTVLGKVVTVLDAFTAEDHWVSFSELVRRTGLNKTTLHRLLAELVGTRLIDRSGSGYRLGRHLFELGMRASVERGLIEVATPFLEDLRERTRETVHLGVLEGEEVVYVAKIGGHLQAESPSRVGGRMPLYCTAIGKAMLAHSPSELKARTLAGPLPRRTPRTITAPGRLARQLDTIAETGVAFEYEESAVGIVCVAAAILDADDRPVAGVSVTGPVTRLRPDAHTNEVRAAAAGIAATLVRRENLRHD